MDIERGSDMLGQYIEVRSGRYDGARGHIVAVDWVQGQRHITVALDNGGGNIVIIQPQTEKASDGDLPREFGS